MQSPRDAVNSSPGIAEHQPNEAHLPACSLCTITVAVLCPCSSGQSQVQAGLEHVLWCRSHFGVLPLEFPRCRVALTWSSALQRALRQEFIYSTCLTVPGEGTASAWSTGNQEHTPAFQQPAHNRQGEGKDCKHLPAGLEQNLNSSIHNIM